MATFWSLLGGMERLACAGVIAHVFEKPRILGPLDDLRVDLPRFVGLDHFAPNFRAVHPHGELVHTSPFGTGKDIGCFELTVGVVAEGLFHLVIATWSSMVMLTRWFTMAKGGILLSSGIRIPWLERKRCRPRPQSMQAKSGASATPFHKRSDVLIHIDENRGLWFAVRDQLRMKLQDRYQSRSAERGRLARFPPV